MDGDGEAEVGGPTVDEVFRDFLGRRAGIIRALTADVKEFVRQCDPQRGGLCLYGLPDGRWKVSLPVPVVPPQIPEPTLAINFARDDRIQQKDWLSLVAVHSDAWLLSVAFFNAAGYFDRAKKQHLFDMINDLPTIFEIMTGRYKPVKVTEMLKWGTNEEESLCGACEGTYKKGEFWIYCDFCETWYHGKCVRVTLAEVRRAKKYKCTSCRYRDRWRRHRQ